MLKTHRNSIAVDDEKEMLGSLLRSVSVVSSVKSTLIPTAIAASNSTGSQLTSSRTFASKKAKASASKGNNNNKKGGQPNKSKGDGKSKSKQEEIAATSS
ncbi:hypothetical protein OSB04_001216 [Centaurea solstitialis]|uniref:Uncharacterized protein n=1 Tax=Centaurea solstitialis TaxID=347529 RepID=A0AA38WSJ4_9ASTR|nr:hypothetical protein OSB04_001216 [Centaurea solstitialis]